MVGKFEKSFYKVATGETSRADPFARAATPNWTGNNSGFCGGAPRKFTFASSTGLITSVIDRPFIIDRFQVDFWKEPNHFGDFADVMISSKHALDMERRFRRANITYDIRVPDVEKLIIRNERTQKRSGYGRRLHDDPILDSEPDGDQSRVGKLKKAKYSFGDYASYADMMKYMRTIEFYYPNITKIVRLGVTHEGKPIEGMKVGPIGYPISSTSKRAIWVDGNIHAREWASSHTALYFINQLVSGYGKDDTITHYVNSLNFYVMPCLNPDGYEYTRSSPNPSVRLWRKNRSPEKCHRSLWGGEKCCQGVDLNRNFKFHWAVLICKHEFPESGSSYEPCSNIYHGDHVFSEPESRAVRDFLDSDELRGKVDGFITLHSYAQLWIYPYSHAQQNYPEDISELVGLGQSAEKQSRSCSSAI
ncbi:zinc carboxypeptidase [Ancylostoma ceylanicum]|uniref:Zinc carboxypeptidase n=1 Tax=Ancylostoma ceylanicum TaxID=53326 RepID=A0A0D6LJE1_9BILA|nr:zinc carboxypeptidase [Ancylostoma ceylanicum]